MRSGALARDRAHAAGRKSLMFAFLERAASRLLPHSRALLLGAVVSFCLPVALVLFCQDVLHVELRWSVILLWLGQALLMWALGLFMLARWFRPGRDEDAQQAGGVHLVLASLRRLLDAVFLLAWFLGPFAFLWILRG